jgi:heme/copper-type cytochrome/quinol oxidase subunit 2
MALSRGLRLAAVAAAVVAGTGLSGCGDDDDGTDAGPTTTTVASPTTGGDATTTTAGVPATTTTTATGRVVDYAYREGTVEGDDRVTVKRGEQLTIRMVSDVVEEVHVHTYDLRLDLAPGIPGRLTFTPDIPGVHEVELEISHRRIFSLEVQ